GKSSDVPVRVLQGPGQRRHGRLGLRPQARQGARRGPADQAVRVVEQDLGEGGQGSLVLFVDPEEGGGGRDAHVVVLVRQGGGEVGDRIPGAAACLGQHRRRGRASGRVRVVQLRGPIRGRSP